MGKKKKPSVIDLDLMNKMDTRELMGYLKRLHQCEESFENSDLDVNSDLNDEQIIYFKETEKWQTAYKNVKSVLRSRENIK